MAKATVNMSQAIRDYKQANKAATAMEIREALGKQGIKVNPTLVYAVLGKKKKGRGRKVAQRGRDNSVQMVRVDLLNSAITFADGCESIDEAIEALKIVQRIRKPR